MKHTILHKGKFLHLIDKGSWEFVKRINCTGIVVILAVNDEGEVIFVEQPRVPVGKNVIEFPAGLVNDLDRKNESLASAAKRELEEETGYRAKKMALITTGPAGSGFTSEILTIFRAVGLKKVGAGGGDETESITVHEVPLKKASSWLRSMQRKGRLVDPKVYAGLYFLEKKG